MQGRCMADAIGASPVSWCGGKGRGHALLLWVLFFLICFGLGYPTLRYFDPRTRGPNDSSIYYYEQVSGKSLPGGVLPNAVKHYRFRILVPLLAKPFYWLVNGRSGSWEPVF